MQNNAYSQRRGHINQTNTILRQHRLNRYLLVLACCVYVSMRICVLCPMKLIAYGGLKTSFPNAVKFNIRNNLLLWRNWFGQYDMEHKKYAIFSEDSVTRLFITFTCGQLFSLFCPCPPSPAIIWCIQREVLDTLILKANSLVAKSVDS